MVEGRILVDGDRVASASGPGERHDPPGRVPGHPALRRHRLIPAAMGIFGHGNVAGLGQALDQYAEVLPFIQGRNEQNLVHLATGFAKASRRRATLAVTASIGPGALNMVTGAALATVNRIPVLLLPDRRRGGAGRRRTGRAGGGGLLDLDAAAKALADARLAGLGLDVFDPEPPRYHPVFERPDVVLSPHLMGLSVGATRATFTAAARGVTDVLLGRRPAALADPDWDVPDSRTTTQEEP